MTTDAQAIRAYRRPSTAVQILAIICFTGFAIPVSIVAMGEFGIIGVGLAAFFGWQWTRVAGLGSGPKLDDLVADVAPTVDPEVPERHVMTPSGNASFDAYRDQMMNRLEEENTKFQGFLERLRDAKDETEFDSFMDERARVQRDALAS